MKRRIILACASIVALLGASIGFLVNTAHALTPIDPIGGGAFQLDGDAQQSTPAGTAGDDWSNVCHQVSSANCPNGGNTNGASSVAWAVDGNSLSALNASIFTGGGSKDPQDINNWAWKDNAGGLPDKDNLLHAFGVRYSLTPSASCPSGGNPTCELLYFGSDRYDNSGDAQQGFWLLQNRITLGNNAVGGGSGFNGVHKTGDLLIVSDFSNGGSTSTITVYSWDTSVSGNLKLIVSSANANCSTAAPGAAFCGIVDPTNGTVSPWPFLDKSGNSTFLQGEMYEGGINLSLLPAGFASECFASLESETRSSTSTTATLKDFVLTNFGDCSAHLATQVSSSSAIPGTAVHDTATVTGNKTSLTPTGSVTFFMCSFAAGTTDVCDKSDAAHTGTSIGTVALSGSAGVATAQAADVNTAASPLTPGRYCFRAEWPGDTNYVGALSEYSGATECFTVIQGTTNTVTEPRLSSNNTAITTTIPVGTSVVDHALITGTAGFGTPTGTVAFRICNPSQVTGAAGAQVCAAGAGTALSGNPVTATAVANSSPPQSEATSSPAVVTDAVGVWCFAATYTPDTANYSGSGDATHGECFTTVNSPTGTVTEPRLSSNNTAIAGPVAVGTSVVDHALITGAAGFGSPTGSVAFRICNPTQVTGAAGSEVCAAGNGTALSGNPVTVTAVAGSSPPQTEATSTPAVVANIAGVWCFAATYTPDTLRYTSSSDATHDECFTVQDSSSPTSLQNWLPNDHVVVSTTGGTALNGSLDISLRSGTCTGTTVYTEPTITLTNTASGTGFDTTNTTVKVNAANNATPYIWRIVFTPAAGSFVTGFTNCVENTSITITNS